MKSKAIAGGLLSGVFLLGGISVAQEVEGPNEKAKRYHTLLLKRPGNPTVFSRFVDAWLDTGDKKQLKSWLEKSAKEGGVAEWQVLAALHEYLGEDEASLDAFNEAVKLDEKNAALRLSRAKLQAKLLSFEAALKDLEVAAKDDKLGVEASKLQGIYLARAGRIDEAVKVWKEVIERFPKDEELREDLIEVEVVEGLYDDAIAASQALVDMTKDPYKKALRQLRLGDIQILGNKREEGLKTYETIMNATGADTWLEREVLAQIERVFTRDDDIQGLRDFFQKLREAHPRRVSVRKALARQMALNGEMDEAIALFREVLKITPGDVGNREEFIAFLETNERWKDAREELSELIKQREDDPLLWERMAGIEQKQKNREGMKAALAKVRDLKKGTAEGLIAVAALYTQAEFAEEAEALLREGRTAYPESGEVIEALASFLIQNKKEEEALAIWTEMAASADREGLLRVARSLTGHGKSEEAFKLLQKRMGEFGEDPLILSQFCALAFSEEEAVIALPFGLELVSRASSPTDLEAAIGVASRVIKKAQKQDEVLEQLEGKADLGISERCLIADLYSEQGDTIEALRVLDAAQKADEGLLARFYRVRFDENRGELEGAIASLREIIELPEGRKTVHVRRLVGLLERSGDIEGALAAVDDWKRMAPGDQAAWTRRAQLLSDHGEPDKAVLELRRMIGKFGPEEDSRSRLAAALMEANEHRSAQRIYEQLYEEGEDLSVKLKWVGELAKVAQREGTLEELLADFERRKRESPNSVAPLLAIAEIHNSLNQYEERRSALLEASRRRPNDIKLLQHIADVEVRAGEFDRAVGLLKDAAKRDTTPGTKKKLASLFLKNGEFYEGLRLLKELPEESNDPRKVEATALSLMTMGEWDLAVRHLAELLPKHQGDWRLSYLNAIALEMDGQDEVAFETYKRLLDVNDTIKGLKPIYDPKRYMRGYWLQRAQSEGAMNGWVKLQIFSNMISSEKSNLAQMRQGYSSYRSSSMIQLPGTPEEVRMMSLIKASALVEIFPDDEQEEVRSSLNIKGVERIDLFRLSISDQKKLHVKVNELLEAEPENPKFLQLWVSSRSAVGKVEGDELKRLRKILDQIIERSPADAMGMFSGMMYRKEIERAEAASLLEKMLASVTDDEDREKILPGLVSLVTREIVKDEKDEFDKLAKMVVAEAVAVEEKPKDRTWIDQSLTLAMNMGESDSAIVLLNRLSKWLLDEKVATTLSSHYYHGGYGSHRGSWGRGSSGSQTLSAPVYPLMTVKGIPRTMGSIMISKLTSTINVKSDELKRRAELLALLKKKEGEETSPKAPVEPLEAFRGRTAEIKLPILRAMLETALGDEKSMPAFVANVAKSNNVDELNLVAGYLWKSDQLLETYQVLTRLRMMTLSRTERKQIDGQLAMVGATLAGKKDLEWEREPAQRAALRLRKALTNYNERPALLNVMVKLGLQKEAEKMEKSPSSRSRSSLANRSARRTGTQWIVSLVTDGRKEEAAREAAKLLKTYARNGNSRYDYRRLMGTLNKLDLEDEVLKKLHPEDSQSLSRRMLYANFALSADRKDLARPFFEAIVKERPKQMEARVGLFMSMPTEERNYQDFLKEVDGKVDTDALLDSMTALWSKADDQYDETMAMLDLTEGILKNLKPSTDEKRNLSWVPYHLISATRDTYYNGVRLADLYGNRKNSSHDKEKSARFDEATKKVFIAMLKHPQTTEQGFMMLSKAKTNLKISDEEIVKHAQTSLREVIRRKKLVNSSGYNHRNGLWVLFQRNGSSSSYSLDDVPGPMDFLISRGEIQSVMSEEILEVLKENQPERFEALQLARRITSVEPEEGAKLFSEWYAALEKGEGDQKKTATAISAGLVDFAENLLLFDLKPAPWTDDLEAKLIGIKSVQWSDNSGWTELSGKWLRWIAKNKDREAVKEFVYKTCEAAMGPREKWSILAEIGANNLPQEYRQPMYTLAAKLISYCLVEEAVLPVIELALEHDFEKSVQNFNIRNALYPVIQGLETGEDLVNWFKASGVFSISSQGEQGPLVTMGMMGVIDLIRSKGDDHKKEILTALETVKMDPLYKKLIVAQLQSSSEKAKPLAEAWEERTELLKAMAEKNPTFTSARLKMWFPGYESKEAGPKLQAFLKELQTGQNDELMKKAKQWLADGVTLDDNDYRGRKLWAEVIKIAEADAELAGRIVEKIYDAVQMSPRLSRSRTTYGGFVRKPLDSWNGYFLEHLVEYGKSVDFIAKVKLVDGIYRGKFKDELLEPQATGGNYSYYVRNDFQRSMNAIGKPDDSKRKKIELLFSKIAETLSPAEQSTFLCMVIPALVQSHSLSKDDIDPLTKWADEELRKKSGVLADGLVIYVQLAGANRVSGDQRKKLLETAGKALVKVSGDLDAPSPLVIDFVYGLLSNSYGANLFAGKEQWSWLAGIMSSYPNGQRAIPLSRALNIFEYLSRVEFPEKNDAAKELMSAVDGTLITQELLLKFRNQNSRRGWISQLLPLSLAAGDLELAKRLIQQNSQNFRGDLALMMDVAESIDAKTAAKLAPATTMRYTYANLPRYTKTTAASIAEVVEALPARDRFRFEVMAASLYDTEDEGSQPEVLRPERLAKMAARFEKEAPGDSGPRWQLINIIVSETKLVKTMMPHLKKESSKTSLATALALQSEGGRSTDGQALIKIIKLWLNEEILAGRPEVMSKQIEILIKKLSGNNDYNIRYAGKELTSTMKRHLVIRAMESDEEAKKLLPLSKRNLEHRMAFDRGSWDDEIKGVVWGDLMVHVLAGESKAWYDRVEKLDKDAQKAYAGPLGAADRYGLQQISRNETYRKEDRSQDRVEFVGRLLSDPVFLERAVPYYTRLSTIMDSGLVNREELYRVIDAFPKDHPRKAEFMMEKAGVMGWRDNKVDEAGKIYEEARKLALSLKNDQIVHLCDGLRARLLGQKNRISESWKFGQRVDPKHLPEADQKWFANESKKWKEAATKKTAPPEEKVKETPDEPGIQSDQPTDSPTPTPTTQPEIPAK